MRGEPVPRSNAGTVTWTKFPRLPEADSRLQLLSNNDLLRAEGGGQETEDCSEGSNFKAQNMSNLEPNWDPENWSGPDSSLKELCNSGQNTSPFNPAPISYKRMISFLCNIYIDKSVKTHICPPEKALNSQEPAIKGTTNP